MMNFSDEQIKTIVDTVARIVPELITHGRRLRPGLGIEMAEAGLARRLKLSGVLVMMPGRDQFGPLLRKSHCG